MPKNADGYYRSTFVIGKTADGKPKRVTIRALTKREHDEKLAEAKRLHMKGVSRDSLTVSDWAARWLEVYKANASRGQKVMYERKLRINILPVIGRMPVRSVRASDLQRLLNDLAGGKFSTVQKIKLTLVQMFADADLEGIIERNPASRLELPNVSATPRRPITEAERRVIFQVAQTHNCGAYVLTMLFCGLRRGECIALRIGDVDLDKMRLSVTKSINLLETNIGYEKGPKSNAGIREVPIPGIIKPYLLPLCTGKIPSDILFPKSDGKHATKQTCRWWWQSFMRQCHIAAGAKLYRNAVQYETSPFGNEVTPHFLRHTYATDLYSAGVDEMAQRIFLGHTSSDVTDVYRKMSDIAFERARGVLDVYYFGLDLPTPPTEI